MGTPLCFQPFLTKGDNFFRELRFDLVSRQNQLVGDVRLYCTVGKMFISLVGTKVRGGGGGGRGGVWEFQHVVYEKKIQRERERFKKKKKTKQFKIKVFILLSGYFVFE